MENIESNNTEYYYEQANMLRERGDSEEAIKAYDKVIELDPNHVEAYYFKGYALELLVQTSGDISKYQEAIKAYNKAIELNPNYAPAYSAKAVAWKTIGDIESKKAFDEFYKLRPHMRRPLDDEREVLNSRQKINYKDFIYKSFQ
ncbi:MAG: tetratricopeptide repeat protein [Rickettsia endosymbiont of Oxypoda opaca]|nr:tetratricopeptide repeat protein [Rickettsia endosymbiont of Oxypoda opaca]